MMKKKLKIWIHSDNSGIKECTIARQWIFLAILFIIASTSGVGYLGYDYHLISSKALENKTLTADIQEQQQEIQAQRKQIQKFAEDFNLLKKKIITLQGFEEKVRIIAGIKKESPSSGLFGIGGISEDTLDHDLPLTDKHNSLIREMHQQSKEMELAVKKQTEDFEELIKRLDQKKSILAATPSIRPVSGWITSKFGYRTSPFTGRKEFHSGLDIANKRGTKLVATANGRVSYAGKKMLIGNLVTIDHGHGLVTKYGHLKKLLVKRGDKVKRGDVIGLMGNTGRSTGPHVHYEVRVNGLPVNPAHYILN